MIYETMAEYEAVSRESEPSLAELKAELALMRAQLFLAKGLRSVRELALADWFGISGAEARILADLCDANGRPVAYKGLCLSVARAHRVKLNTVNVHVWSLRAAMKPEAILTVRNIGYQLSAAGLAECKEAIRSWDRFS